MVTFRFLNQPFSIFIFFFATIVGQSTQSLDWSTWFSVVASDEVRLCALGFSLPSGTPNPYATGRCPDQPRKIRERIISDFNLSFSRVRFLVEWRNTILGLAFAGNFFSKFMDFFQAISFSYVLYDFMQISCIVFISIKSSIFLFLRNIN